MVPDAEKPFDLPKNWRWIKFGDLVHFQIGKTPARGNRTFWDNGTYPWVSIADMSNGKILNNTKETVSEEAKDIVFKGGISPRGTLIMSFKLTIGKLAILDMDAFHNEAIISIYPNHGESDTIRDYLFYIINALDLLRDTKAAIKGATLNKTSLNEILVPLPPLAEQKRIVVKIEEIFSVIDQIGTRKAEALTIINNMRQTALQDAIMGVLVEQDETDEPASELYEKVKNEKEKLVKEKKIKKEKPLPEIEENETPFEIPESWKFMRLKEAVYNHGQKKPDKTFSYIDIGSIDNKHTRLNAEEKIIEPEDAPSRARKIVKMGDILYSTVRPYLHNACIIDREFSMEPIASTGFAVMRTHSGILNRFLFHYLLSPTFDLFANDTANAKGTAYPAINDTKLYQAVIPLPPLNEQHRIVEKIDEIMAICDQMEAIFDGTSEANEALEIAE